jgi:galactose mutarotase-like enzyme
LLAKSRIIQARDVSSEQGQSLELTYLSKDDEGYPGDLSVRVVFTVLADRNALKIEYSATTDKDTIVNLTNHAYFNLAGQGNGDILGHQLILDARKFTSVDPTLIPTGEMADVHSTPFDFLKPVAIGARIEADNEESIHTDPLSVSKRSISRILQIIRISRQPFLSPGRTISLRLHINSQPSNLIG